MTLCNKWENNISPCLFNTNFVLFLSFQDFTMIVFSRNAFWTQGSQELTKFCSYFEIEPQSALMSQFFCFHFATACPFGFFGLNCSRECHCQNGGVCDSLDGHCTCTPGWMGTFCQQRKCLSSLSQLWVWTTDTNCI